MKCKNYIWRWTKKPFTTLNCTISNYTLTNNTLLTTAQYLSVPKEKGRTMHIEHRQIIATPKCWFINHEHRKWDRTKSTHSLYAWKSCIKALLPTFCETIQMHFHFAVFSKWKSFPPRTCTSQMTFWGYVRTEQLKICCSPGFYIFSIVIWQRWHGNNASHMKPYPLNLMWRYFLCC